MCFLLISIYTKRTTNVSNIDCFWLNLDMETEVHKLITVLGAVGITAMLQRGMSGRMLLYRYRLYLLYLKSKWRHKYTYKIRRGQMVKVQNWHYSARQILKPLGLCVYCYGFWIGVLIYASKWGIYGIVEHIGIYWIILELWMRSKRD